MSTSRPQVAVIGAGFGGLSAAIHLRLAGHPVTIFEANERTGGRANQIRREGFTFDTGPSLLNYPWVFEDLFRAAGRQMRDYIRLLSVDPSVEFRWPDGERFQLSSDLRRLLAESERVEPGSAPGMTAFLQDAGEKYRISFDKLVTQNEDNPLRWMSGLSLAELWRTRVWKSLDSELRRFFRGKHIREAFGAYAMYLGGSPYELPGLFSILAYGELAYGLFLPEGGIYGAVRAIERLARELGVEIQTSAPVRRIRVRNGAVEGLELESGVFFPAPVAVSNRDVPETQSGLLGKANRRPPRMTPGVLTFYWAIRGKLEHIGHHTIFLPGDYRRAFDQLSRQGVIPDGLPFYTSVPSETDPSLAPPGDSVLFVLVPVPLLSQMPGANWTALTADIRARVLERLRSQGAGFDPQCILFEEVWTPKDWRTRFGLHDGSAFGAAHTLFQVGPFRDANYSRECRGLYYTGAGTTPGTGMPMVLLSGKMTAARIAADVT